MSVKKLHVPDDKLVDGVVRCANAICEELAILKKTGLNSEDMKKLRVMYEQLSHILQLTRATKDIKLAERDIQSLRGAESRLKDARKTASELWGHLHHYDTPAKKKTATK